MTKKAWQIEYETMENSMPVILEAEEQGWSFSYQVEALEDEMTRMKWHSNVPGSGALEHVITILNPAPLKEGVEALFPYTDMIAPNETEFAALTGTDILGKGSRMLMSAGIREVIVTRGSKGYCYISDGKLVTEDCIKAPVVDTTGAGDTFLGAMAVKLADDEHIESALRFANRAAAVTVQRRGAQVAIPTLLEVEESFRAQRQRV